MSASTKIPSVKPHEPQSSNNKEIATLENPIEQSKEHICEQKENNAEKKDDNSKEKEQMQENIKEEQVKGNAVKNEKEISKSCKNPHKSGKGSEKTLSLMKTQSLRADTPKKTSKCDENEKTKSSFDVKSVMEKGGHSKLNKGTTSGIRSSKKLCSHYSIIKPISKVSAAKTAVEVLSKQAAKDLSGIDDLPLPLPDGENSTQRSISIKIRDDDDTGENVEELKEDTEKSVYE